MYGQAITYFGNFTPVGDIMVMATIFVFAILIKASYINKTRNFIIFRRTLVMLFVASVTDVLWHMLLYWYDKVPDWTIFAARIVYHLSIFSILVLLVEYCMETMHISEKSEKKYIIISVVIYVVLFIVEVAGTFLKYGFYIEPDGKVHPGINFFPIGFIFYVGVILYLMYIHRGSVYRQILYGVLGATGVAFLVLFIQSLNHQSSFTTATFLFPVFALLYLVHSNPYNIDTGSLNAAAFDDLIMFRYRKKRETILMSLYLHEFDGNGLKYPKEIQETIRQFSTQYFKNAVLFQMSNGHMILLIPVENNPHFEVQIGEILGNYAEAHSRYQLTYKIVITKSYDSISEHNEYVSLIQYVEGKMQINQIRYVRDDDIDLYQRQKYILHQMEDIQKKSDLEDERIQVYCQPVLNAVTGEYDTAEALMRMTLPEIGMVFPDQFIPLAEQYGYIHTMSLIILHKTCMKIKMLLDRGYLVKRISVNFSISDIREKEFCENVERIIEESGIPHNRIAIEVTESQNESDFLMLKDKIEELRKSGIKFYLDDFGTGYSNFERIMQLPFDIIKFDRSLVIASGDNEKSMVMVEHLARMFSDMNYAVLYEGVENEQDEERCEKMAARYLQGYKYSRPIPMDRLTEYFRRMK